MQTFKQVMSLEALPVLHTDLCPDSILERIDKRRGWQDLEERAMSIQGNLLAQEADTTLRGTSAKQKRKHHQEDTTMQSFYRGLSQHQIF